jgi:SAM-dependent methyltransferase
MERNARLWERTNSTLPCCLTGSREVTVVGVRDRDGKPLRTVLGMESGLIWTDPRPSSEEVRRFYGEEYRVQYKGAYEPKPKHVARGGLVALSRFERLSKFLPSSTRLLDAGSGGGEFLCLATNYRGCTGIGIEPNEGYAEFSTKEYGLKVTQGFFSEIEPDTETMDVVTLFHVLEHVEDPVGSLSVLASWLRPGGRLVVEVPNAESKAGSPSGKYHLAHLFNYNLVALSAIGERAGLSVERQWTSPDGGNVEIVFKKSNPVKKISLKGNAEKILRVLKSHTPLSHFLSGKPLVRPLRKIADRRRERKIVGSGLNGGKLLKFVFGNRT